MRNTAISGPSFQLHTPRGKVECVPDEVIVGVEKDSFSPLTDTGGEVVERFDLGNQLNSGGKEILRIKLENGSDLAESMSRLSKMPGVAYAIPNHVIRQESDPVGERMVNVSGDDESIPNDLVPGLWGLKNTENPGADISAVEAWKVTTGSSDGPLIAVIDGGADYNHPDLRANIARNDGEIPGDGIDNDGNGVVDDYFGYNAYDNNGDPLDKRGHGTHVSGTIAAVGNNGQGVVGVNWQARILPIKIFNDEGVTTVDTILRGIEYARKRGALITNNSWGGANFNPAIFDAFAATPGLHIAAAGNSGGDIEHLPSFPANFPLDNILTVGATNKKDLPAVFSNFGRNTVELFAPGRDVLSTMPGGAFGLKSGTSMAAPHVTGVAGLIASAFPQLGPEEIKERLIFSTDPLSSVAEMSISGGRLNAARALSQDSVAPAAPNDFWVTGSNARSARFSWTGTGDDGWKNGAATAFEVRVSDQPINEENWNRAEPISTPRGQEIGQYHHAQYRQHPQKEDTRVYAGFKAVDEVGNRSELRTTVATLPSIPVVTEEDFDQGAPGWEGDGRWQLIEYPERGKVWSCQPAGKRDGTYNRLTSPIVNLEGVKNSFLRFESRQDFDFPSLVYVDVSKDRGENWERLDRIEENGRWGKREYDLSKYDGETIQVRISSEAIAVAPGEGTIVDNFEVLGER